MMSHHRRLTPVPTETALVFGTEIIDKLPSISEAESSPPPLKPRRSFTHSTEALSSSSSDSGSNAKMDTTGSSRIPVELLQIPPSVTKDDKKAEKTSADDPGTSETGVVEPLMKPANGQKTDYIKLHFSTTDLHEVGRTEKDYYDEEFRGPEETVQESLLALFFAIFHVGWSIGVGFWLNGDGYVFASHLTYGIVVFSAIFTVLSYLLNGKIKKKKVWSSSKLLWLLFLLPGLTPILMALSNIYFAGKERQDPKYVRPWTNTKLIFLVESLTLAFPQCVLQLCVMMTDVKNFPSVRGIVVGTGIFILTLGITFARVRFDSAKKYDRFGLGLDRYIRYTVIWAGKVLWIITYCCFLVTAQILYGAENGLVAPIVVIAGVLILFEVPVLISSIPACQRFAAACLSLFFLLPQFTSLISLIFWVNVDTTIYAYNIGSCILGLFFWVESICIMGWLLDRCTGREIDFISNYPHFFGNFFSNCFKSHQRLGKE